MLTRPRGRPKGSRNKPSPKPVDALTMPEDIAQLLEWSIDLHYLDNDIANQERGCEEDPDDLLRGMQLMKNKAQRRLLLGEMQHVIDEMELL